MSFAVQLVSDFVSTPGATPYVLRQPPAAAIVASSAGEMVVVVPMPMHYVICLSFLVSSVRVTLHVFMCPKLTDEFHSLFIRPVVPGKCLIVY